MWDGLRKLVSGKKNRYKEDGFNLDLTYITPRIIAMSLPGEGVHKVYRNPIENVSKLLNEKHPGKYRVLNLSGLKYNYEQFQNCVKEYTWEDHYPPSIDLLFRACRDIHEWLTSDHDNIIAVNCKAGKGRTGTLICCYMIFCGRINDPEVALRYYKTKRFYKGGGVTQPSQIRYVHYFHSIFNGRIKGPLIKELSRVHSRTIPHMSDNGSRLIFEIKTEDRIIYSNKKTKRDKQALIKDDWDDSTLHEISIINSNLRLQGDITCFLNHWGTIKIKKICRFSFNTAFISPLGEEVFEKHQIDPDNFKHSKKVANNFSVVMIFNSCCNCTADLDLSDRCSLCKNVLNPEEIEKWGKIKQILIDRIEFNPSALLFKDPIEDDIDAVLSEPINESDLSSDGSAT